MNKLYGLLLLPGLSFAGDRHIVSQFEITSDNDGYDGTRILVGYEKDVDEQWRVGALQGFYEMSDINGRVKFHETRGTYKYKIDEKSTIKGFVSALYTKSSRWDSSVGGDTYMDDTWTTPIGSITYTTKPTDKTYFEAGYEHNLVESTVSIGNQITVDTFSASADYMFTPEWTIVGALAYQDFDMGNLNDNSDAIAQANGYNNATEAFTDYGLEWSQNLKGSKDIQVLKLVFTPEKVPGLVLQAKARWYQSDFNFKPGFLSRTINGQDQFKRGVFWAPDRYERYMLVAGYSKAFYNDNWVWSASYGYGTQKVKDHYGVGADKVTFDKRHRAEEINLKLRGAITPNMYLTSYYKQDTDAGSGQTAYRWEQIGINLEYSF